MSFISDVKVDLLGFVLIATIYDRYNNNIIYADKSPDSGSETWSEGSGSTVGSESRGREETQQRNHLKQTIAIELQLKTHTEIKESLKGLIDAVKLKVVSDKELSEP